jgi:flagellar P-ring protein precursor FlgI
MKSTQYLVAGFLTLAVLCASLAAPPSAQAAKLLKDICRVKGQEENVLQGLGLVVGLKGTGDSGQYLPTMRMLASSMAALNHPVSDPGNAGGGGLVDLKDTKNVALVMVTATVRSTGGRRGDQLDCTVSAISAKSLDGGQLVFAALKGPNINDQQIYALAQGKIQIDSADSPTTGIIHNGCRMEADIPTEFQRNGKITLVLDKNYASFPVATEVVETITGSFGAQYKVVAQAIDAANIEVEIPEQYLEVPGPGPVPFIADLLNTPILETRTDARVVVNRQTGAISVGADVEITPGVVYLKNYVVDATEGGGSRFEAIDPAQTGGVKLKSLVDALNALRVPADDVIEILKVMERAGQLGGRLIIQ